MYYSKVLYDEMNLYQKISIVFLYKHIAHTGSGQCMKKYNMHIGLPVCVIYAYGGSFGYEQIAHTASVVWVGLS